MPATLRVRTGPLLSMLLAALVLGGCAATAPNRLQQDPRFAIPVGSTLELNRTIELPGRGDFLYLQDGHTSGLWGIQEVYPHCYLETRQRPPGPVEVPPTTFTITAVDRSFYYTGMPFFGGGFIKVGSDGDGGGSISQWFYVTRLTLEPADPAVDVYRLTCQADRLDAAGPASEQHHLTIAHIRQALGDIFTLKLEE